MKNGSCLSDSHLFEPQAEDILTDEDLLDLFRIVRQVLRKDPDAERISKLLFCIYYALTDHVQFSKPYDEDIILFRGRDSVVHSVQLPTTSSCCTRNKVQDLDHSTPSTLSTPSPTMSQLSNQELVSFFSVQPYNTLKTQVRYTPIPVDKTNSQETLTEPLERGFYYQEGRIAREPILLQRYAEQGVLTQATLVRKRKKQADDSLSVMPISLKKPKIPHRHGDFESRRDDIIVRLRSITLLDLEQKARQLPSHFTLAIKKPIRLDRQFISASIQDGSLSPDQCSRLLKPSLSILASHANMKPHLDNGMNQNGIHYNPDYFRLYLA
ncbi:hypothetical protein A0J61_07657, partial [Choanephora cucurbitarum]